MGRQRLHNRNKTFLALRIAVNQILGGIWAISLVLAMLFFPACSFGQAKPCGVERWPVKTLQDKQGGAVARQKPLEATVAELTSFPARGKAELLKDDSTRISPQEMTVYTVHAVLIGFKKETDQDIHIVIADPNHVKNNMIVEIPAGACVAPAYNRIFSRLQALFAQDFGKPAAKFKTLPTPVPITVTGIGFFDFSHGQTGVAKNAFELHPVLSIDKGGSK